MRCSTLTGSSARDTSPELTTRIKHVGRLIGERDPGRARARDAQLLAECNGVVKPVPRQNLQPALTEGLIDTGAHPATGTLFPQPWIRRDGVTQRMDALIGSGWRLVVNDATLREIDQATMPVKATVVRLGSAALTETEGVLAGWFTRQRCKFALVRPDHYVYGVANDAQELGVMLARLNNQSGGV
jgi:3-(3-hydroxy-phenyl)propionate hydroxylase